MGRPRKEKVTLSPIEEIATKIGDDWKDVLQDLEAADSDGLKTKVTQANQSIHDTKLQLEANPDYMRAKEDAKLLSSGLKEVRKRQNAIIKVCLELRKERGEA